MKPFVWFFISTFLVSSLGPGDLGGWLVPSVEAKKRKPKSKRKRSYRRDKLKKVKPRAYSPYVLHLGVGFAFVGPKELNDEILHRNDNSEFKTIGGTMATFDTAIGGDLYFGFRLSKVLDVGVFANYPNSQSNSVSGEKTGKLIEITYTAASPHGGFRSNYTFYERKDFRFFVGAGIGITFHRLTRKTTIPYEEDLEIQATSTDPMYMAALGAVLKVDESIGVFAEAGYRLEKSGPLVLTKNKGGAATRGDPLYATPGENLAFSHSCTPSPCTDWVHDMSGVFVNAGLALRL